MNPSPSHIKWMVARRCRLNMSGPYLIEELKSGFEKITEAKSYKNGLKEEDLIILPYYE